MRCVRVFTVFLLILSLLSAPAFAQHREVGLGIMVGDPTGLSAKYWTERDRAFDFGVGWSSLGQGSVHLHTDYLIHHFDLLKVGMEKFTLYYGLGARLRRERDTQLGLRVPMGISYLFPRVPLDVFLEFVPLMDLVPSTSFGINAALGGRFYF